jgi:hypothetical protein
MKTSINRIIIFGMLVVLLAACAPEKLINPSQGAITIENPNSPPPGDGKLVRGEVEIVKTELLFLKSNPLQYGLNISFFTPTPCHQFQVSVDQPGSANRINVGVYSLMKKDQVCALMRLNTPTEAFLVLSKVPIGHYSVWVNGEKAAEFDVL